MSVLKFEFALVGGKIEADVEFEINAGKIVKVTPNSIESPHPCACRGLALPAIANVHSHAFQFQFAGQSEFRTRERDSFWSWREQMYASLRGFDPEAAETNAKRLYRLMVQHGYSTVGEFHYVHHDDEGNPYSELSALADAHIRAANEVGIRICMLPVLYQRGGFDDRPLADAQCRFGMEDESFLSLLSELQSRWGDHPKVTLGMAFHSLRAVDPKKIQTIAERASQITKGGPIHIHVAEQLKEVEDSIATTGKRPVELLFDHAEVDERWCLIHATHLSDSEIEQIADSKAVVGLCPTTEANLGDGVFPAEEFLNYGGRISVGSDSHVSVCPMSELRILEYGQRLTKHRRAVLCTNDQSCGEHLYQQAVCGGVQAMGQGGFHSAGLGEGASADIAIVDPAHPALEGCPMDHLLSRAMFTQHGNYISKVLIGGEWVL